ncbi:hypothetical protein DBV15_00220 [Temnothorax longispinosus]|uniref:Uncharacterized protein n=1 Tax=Temnothorax longispinosus TaxID=300112 RepID=A0A4S2KDK1_9HYME|nr:hypothetical protein DBV15_00220 [Temnothorax longispinosus]
MRLCQFRKRKTKCKFQTNVKFSIVRDAPDDKLETLRSDTPEQEQLNVRIQTGQFERVLESVPGVTHVQTAAARNYYNYNFERGHGMELERKSKTRSGPGRISGDSDGQIPALVPCRGKVDRIKSRRLLDGELIKRQRKSPTRSYELRTARNFRKNAPAARHDIFTARWGTGKLLRLASKPGPTNYAGDGNE